jgi:hypothetical protein
MVIPAGWRGSGSNRSSAVSTLPALGRTWPCRFPRVVCRRSWLTRPQPRRLSHSEPPRAADRMPPPAEDYDRGPQQDHDQADQPFPGEERPGEGE